MPSYFWHSGPVYSTRSSKMQRPHWRSDQGRAGSRSCDTWDRPFIPRNCCTLSSCYSDRPWSDFILYVTLGSRRSNWGSQAALYWENTACITSPTWLTEQDHTRVAHTIWLSPLREYTRPRHPHPRAAPPPPHHSLPLHLVFFPLALFAWWNRSLILDMMN